MIEILGPLLLLAGFAGMEGVAWLSHRYIMHGPLWCWHRSHHRQREGPFERNDLFAVFFAVPAIVCIYLGVQFYHYLVWFGVGITAYGAAYVLFHDGLVHGRFPTGLHSPKGYLKRLVQAHRLHHAVHEKDGAVCFGFLVPPTRAQMARSVSLVRSYHHA